jgi:tetratricopeptide (TPR) repeat protein
MLHGEMRIEDGDVVPNSYVFYDPFYPQDDYNARRISAVTGCTLIPVFFTGHDCIQPFAGTTVARELIEKSVAADVPGLRALANRLRRNHWARKHHLACGLAARHPKWALGIYEKYSVEIPTDRYVDFARELSAKGLIEEAVDWSRRGFEEETQDKGRLNSHATLLIKAKRYEEATRVALIGLALEPGSFVFTRRLSEAFAGMKDLGKAIVWAIASIDGKPADATGHNHLAGLLFQAGRLDEAEQACRRALRFEPDNRAFQNRLDGILVRKDRSAAGSRSEPDRHVTA